MFAAALVGSRRISSVHFTATLPKDASGYAVVVSKKVAHLSVTRHRIKRRVLAALRALPLPASIILFPKSSVLDMSYQQTKIELAELLSKINR
jgi:ribonuclease P protein component